MCGEMQELCEIKPSIIKSESESKSITGGWHEHHHQNHQNIQV